MIENNRVARDAALSCAFMIVYRLRHALRDEDLEAVFEDIRETVNGVIMAALSAKEEEGQ